jgi:hypothetical protein
MNPDTTATPRTDERASYDDDMKEFVPADFARQLERELAEKTNEANTWHQHYRDEKEQKQKLKQAYIELEKEVVRLRKYVEKLEIYAPENEWSQPEWRKLIGSKEEGEDPETLFKLYQFRLAPAPEEPVIQNSRITEPAPEKTPICPTCNSDKQVWRDEDWRNEYICHRYGCGKPILQPQKELAPEWRELGLDEVIQEGDKYDYIHDPQGCANVIHSIGDMPKNREGIRFRTRRPLPTTNHQQISSKLVDEELPLEKEISYLEINASRAADIHTHVVIVDCLRYLRDEIQKLKQK